MEVKTSDVQRENIENYTKRYIELLKQKKVIDEDIKALKEEFKEEGVPVGIVTSVFNRVKAAKKKSDSEKFEEDIIQEWIESNVEIDNAIGELNAK